MTIEAMKHCTFCHNSGFVDTGIMESPVTVCNACNGTGIRQAIEQAEHEISPNTTFDEVAKGLQVSRMAIATLDELTIEKRRSINEPLLKAQLFLKAAERLFKEALSQPAQEPVGEAYLCDACHTPFDGAYECPSCGHNEATKEPVYTSPPQRQPLTDEQIEKLLDAVIADKKTKDQIGDFARAIEAAHGIKGEA